MTLIEASDPFLAEMFERMSPGAETLFSQRQIDEIRRAFGARAPGTHLVEWRAGLHFFKRSYYLVFLLGGEYRSRRRLGVRIPSLALEVLAVGLIGFFVLGTVF